MTQTLRGCCLHGLDLAGRQSTWPTPCGAGVYTAYTVRLHGLHLADTTDGIEYHHFVFVRPILSAFFAMRNNQIAKLHAMQLH